MTSKFSIDNRELLQRISSGEAVVGIDFGNLIVRELAAFRLAAVDSEPVRSPVLAYADSYRDMAKQGVESVPIWSVITDLERNIAPLYRHAQPASERDQVRREHAEWSQATFGNVGPVGPLKHLSKEALEAAAEPGDLSEWADMQFLLWDAQRRAGITDEQITQAMIEKLAVNKQRSWPEPKDGEPRLHIKEQPAPAFPDFDNVLESLDCEVRCNAWESEHVLKACQATYDACRAAMLQASPVCTCPSGDGSLRWPCPVHPGNSPAIPDCWCRTCRPVVLNDMRFVACPDCGNKRCPRANDHRNACTGSNEPGQEGSAYPDTPREVK
ncbi:hypothetical protein AOT23_02862 [Klebsiella pneumoniae]|nr:hypothetical protein AOT23_02862 [Klebsiella pneumoniae]